MAKIERFEDLVAWQRGHELTKALYQVTGNGRFARDRDLRGQMRRAAVSVPSNIAEGVERGGDKEFRQFLAQAKGSTGEIRSQLYIAMDIELITQTQFDHLYKLATNVARILGGLMRYLKKSKLQGSKYR